MKVLHVYKQFFPVMGGIESHIRSMSRLLPEVGRYHPSVMVAGQQAWPRIRRFEGYSLIETGRLGTVASTPLSPLMPAFLGASPADLLHLHFPYPVGDLSYLLAGRRRPLVVTYHSDIVRQKRLFNLYQGLLYKFLDQADIIIATSEPYRRGSPVLQRYAERTEVIPMGVDLDRFAHGMTEEAAGLRKRFGPRMILFVGVLRYYKGLSYLLEAMPRISGHLVLVGDGPERRMLRRQTVRLGLQDRVTFVGGVTDEALPHYYRACDLFVLPACERSEGFGIALLEAMASGKPVVSTELGTGTSWVNVHGKTGLVVPARDANALSGAVEAILNDEQLSYSFGEMGRERAVSKFSNRSVCRRMADVYDMVLERRRGVGTQAAPRIVDN